jgi:hypothetical protein
VVSRSMQVNLQIQNAADSEVYGGQQPSAHDELRGVRGQLDAEEALSHTSQHRVADVTTSAMTIHKPHRHGHRVRTV